MKALTPCGGNLLMLSLLKNSEVRISDFLGKPSAVLQGPANTSREKAGGSESTICRKWRKVHWMYM